jgi:hypothetical protein
MTDARQIADDLLSDPDPSFARILLSFEVKEKVAIHPDDYDLEERLTALGLIANEQITGLGREVAELIRAAGMRARI